MKPAHFQYHRAQNLPEALHRLAYIAKSSCPRSPRIRALRSRNSADTRRLYAWHGTSAPSSALDNQISEPRVGIGSAEGYSLPIIYTEATVLGQPPNDACFEAAVNAAAAQCYRRLNHTLKKAFIDTKRSKAAIFFTPGFLMMTAAILHKQPRIADAELMDILSSNLYRCEGYQNFKTA